MVQLENLQLTVNVAIVAITAEAPFINACLHDVPMRVQEIALHGVRRGASVALAMAQVQTGYELRTMETGFPMGNNPELHEELIEDFDDAAEAIVGIISI